jgi:5-methylcytosine-specific restriction endonuclease McrA
MRFEPNLPKKYSDSELLEEIRSVVRRNSGIVPSPTEFSRLSRISRNTIKNRFRGYKNAIEQAGFAYVERYTPEKIETDLRNILALAGGFRFSHDLYKKHGGQYADKTIRLTLGRTWDGVMDLIGARHVPRVVQTTAHAQRRREIADLSDNAILDEVGRIWSEMGRRPKYAEFNEKSEISTSTYQRRFGSWLKVIQAYCTRENIFLQGSPGTGVTKELLIRELQSFENRHESDLLTYDSYKKNGGTYSIVPFQTHFGSWTRAVEAAGRVSGRQRKYTNDELFDEMQRLWEELGRQPTNDEMLRRGKISPYSYKAVFGSWSRAVLSFCDDRNQDREQPTEISKNTIADELKSHQPSYLEKSTQSIPSCVPIESCDESSSELLESVPGIMIRCTPRVPSKRLRFRVLSRDNFRCRICGHTQKDGVRLHVDHIVAYSRGGETTYENLQVLCEPCNNGKSDTSIHDMAATAV